jgi:hypothetical protein
MLQGPIAGRGDTFNTSPILPPSLLPHCNKNRHTIAASRRALTPLF